jgi:uncharacterized membrane protein
VKNIIIALLIVFLASPLRSEGVFSGSTSTVKVNADVIDAINAKPQIKTGGWIWISVLTIATAVFGYWSASSPHQSLNG